MITALANGTITLTATISTCSQVITRAINIGAPSLSIVSEQTNTCTGSYQTWSLNATPPENGTNFSWSKGYIPPGSDIFIFNESGPFTFADVSGGGIVKLNYNDLCGAARTDGVTIYSNCPGLDFQLLPNPAGNYVTINAPAGKNLIYGIRITDRSGKLQKNIEYKPAVSTARISLNELNSGIYLVSVFDGMNWSSKQLLIQK